MANTLSMLPQQPREWRRRVSVSARVHLDGQWSDCRVLNVSSRGMMLQYSRPLSVGSEVEIRQEGRLVPARVVWREGFRAGVACDAPLPVDDWLSLSSSQASALGLGEGRQLPGTSGLAAPAHHARSIDRRVEAVMVAAVGALTILALAALAATTMVLPLNAIAHALG